MDVCIVIGKIKTRTEKMPDKKCKPNVMSLADRMKKYEDVLTDDERILEDISSAIKKKELVSTQ